MKLSTILEKYFPRAVTNAMLTLIFCLYPHQVLAQSACSKCPAVVEPGADQPDFALETTLFHSAPLDQVVPGFLNTLKNFKETVGIFNRGLYNLTPVKNQFIVNGATYDVAVASIKQAMVEGENGGITAEESSFEIEEDLGPRQAPYPGGLIPTVKFKVFSFLGNSYVFRVGRSFSGPEPLQLFGYISNSWLPKKSIAERAKAFVIVKIKEPDAIESLQTSIFVMEESLKIIFPGYSGAARIGQGQYLAGSFEMLAGIASIGLWTRANTARTAIAWSIVTLSTGQLASAIVYNGSAGEILGAAIPIVFMTPYSVILKFARTELARGLITYNVTFAEPYTRVYQRLGGKTIDAFMRGADDLSKITFAAASTASSESRKIIEAAAGIMRRNVAAGKGWMISASEYLLVKERVGSITATLKRLGNKQIPYAEAFSLHKVFVGQWGAFNKISTAMMPNWKGEYEGFMGHKVLPRILSQLLPDGRHLNQIERDNLLKSLIDNPKAVVDQVMAIKYTSTDGQIRNMFEFIADSGPYAGNGFSQTESARHTAEAVIDAMKGFLLSSRKLNFDVYRIVQVQEAADGTLKLLYPWVDKFGSNSMVATGLTPESVMVFAKQFFATGTSFGAGSKPFAIIKFAKGTYYGAAGPGEGSIFGRVVEQHGGGVANEVVLLTGKGNIAPRASCYVDRIDEYTQARIPIVEFVQE